MRPRAVLFIYGEGGHRAQMKRLYARLAPRMEEKGLVAVGICENGDELDGFVNYSQRGMRDKHSHLKSYILLPVRLIHSFLILVQLVVSYRIEGVISTGPGIAIVPSIALKLLGARIVFIESWSRFETTSMTGRVMYRVADRFYIQNRSLQSHYPDAIYGGLL
ncbi:MAG: UDP-N-acetylglucosamine transferase subunit ALG14 [Gammaproteobacteria bacterium]|nr:UDP-N-acetylglucosamine transferase subunit ALG14 [Gammaproteobacteria bacterium]